MLSILTAFGPLAIPAAESNPARPVPVFQKTPYPRIAMLWASLRGDRSVEAIARHDLIMLGSGSLDLKFNREPAGLADGFTPESIAAAQKKVAEIRQLNPDAVILGDILFYEYHDSWLPEDHPWWMRKNGERQQFWPGTHRMNWYDPEYRRHVVQVTLSMKQSGVDGVFYDNLRDEPEPWVELFKEVRAAVGDEFLILANAGYAVGDYDFAAPYLNGMMYESGWSHNRTEWDGVIKKMQHTESLLRKPAISLIERFEEIRDRAGWPGDAKRGQKPEPDPAARRWSLCFALTIGDYYYLFSDNTSHRHDWHPEYDAKIGLPVQPGERIDSHHWMRVYENAVVHVNLPGAKQSVTVEFPETRKDILTGETGTKFVLPAGEGRIFMPESKSGTKQ
ncbi:MAG: putative glycoside hydrolase [bacterium]